MKKILIFEQFILEMVGTPLFTVFTSWSNAVTVKYGLPVFDDLYEQGKNYKEVIDYYVSNSKMKDFYTKDFLKKLKRDVVIKTDKDKYVIDSFKNNLGIELDKLLNNEEAINKIIYG